MRGRHEHMSINTPFGEDASSPDFLGIANDLFFRVLKELERQLDAAEMNGGEGSAGLAKTANDLRKAIQNIFDERKRLEQSGKNFTNGQGGAKLDLVASRDEIGRRLACLRDAQRARDVPE